MVPNMFGPNLLGACLTDIPIIIRCLSVWNDWYDMTLNAHGRTFGTRTGFTKSRALSLALPRIAQSTQTDIFSFELHTEAYASMSHLPRFTLRQAMQKLATKVLNMEQLPAFG